MSFFLSFYNFNFEISWFCRSCNDFWINFFLLAAFAIFDTFKESTQLNFDFCIQKKLY